MDEREVLATHLFFDLKDSDRVFFTKHCLTLQDRSDRLWCGRCVDTRGAVRERHHNQHWRPPHALVLLLPPLPPPPSPLSTNTQLIPKGCRSQVLRIKFTTHRQLS